MTLFWKEVRKNLNDQSFWVSVDDLKAYANAFYGLIPGESVFWMTRTVISRFPTISILSLWGQYVVPTEGGVWQKSSWQNIRNINYFMTHYQSVQAAEADVNIYVAEMRFFRALEYFNKIQLLGDVPWLEVDLNVDSEELYGRK